MLAFLCRDGHFPAMGDTHTARKLSHDEKSRFGRIDHDAGYDLRTGAGGHGRTESLLLARTPSGRQMAKAFNAFEPAMATQTAAPNTHRYHGGPKYND
jgi:hypothetical protein